MDTDEIFQQVGSSGLFQARHGVLIELLRMTGVWSLFIMTFNIYDPGWMCVRHNIPLKLLNQQVNGSSTYLDEDLSSLQTQSTSSLANFDAKFSRNMSLSNDIQSTNVSSKEYNSTCDMKMCDSVTFNPQSLTLVSEFRLICDETFVLSVIVSINLVGTLLGSVLAGQIGDRYGRKISIYSSTLLLALFQVLATFSVSWKMYAALTFLSGLATGSILATDLVYTTEYFSSKWRGIFAGIPVSNTSVALLAIVVNIFKDWRYIHISVAILASLSFLGVFFVPESFRWLYAHRKYKEMENVLNKMARLNKKDVNVTEILSNIPKYTSKGKGQRKYNYGDLFKTSYMRKITLKCSVGWLLLNMSYYALSYGTKDLAGEFYTNILISGFTEIPFMLLIIPMASNFGRIKISIGFQTIAFLCSVVNAIIIYVVNNETGYEIMKYLTIIAKASIYAGWSNLCIQSLELFPTVVRNLGNGFLCVSAMIGAVMAAYMIPKEMFHVCYSLIVVSTLFTIGLTLSLPETKKRPLEEWILKKDTIQDEGCDVQLSQLKTVKPVEN